MHNFAITRLSLRKSAAMKRDIGRPAARRGRVLVNGAPLLAGLRPPGLPPDVKKEVAGKK